MTALREKASAQVGPTGGNDQLLASAAPAPQVNQPTPSVTNTTPAPTTQTTRPRSRGWDIDIPGGGGSGGGGGGAIDPLTLGAALVVVGLGVVARSSKHHRRKDQ